MEHDHTNEGHDAHRLTVMVTREQRGYLARASADRTIEAGKKVSESAIVRELIEAAAQGRSA